MKYSKYLVATLVSTACLTVSAPTIAANMCNQVWNGTIERIRVQQTSNETVARVYIYPGSNSEYVGYVSSDFMFKAFVAAKEKMTQVTGYTDANCNIQWLDF